MMPKHKLIGLAVQAALVCALVGMIVLLLLAFVFSKHAFNISAADRLMKDKLTSRRHYPENSLCTLDVACVSVENEGVLGHGSVRVIIDPAITTNLVLFGLRIQVQSAFPSYLIAGTHATGWEIQLIERENAKTMQMSGRTSNYSIAICVSSYILMCIYFVVSWLCIKAMTIWILPRNGARSPMAGLVAR